MKTLIATKNPGKAKEIKKFLEKYFDVVSLADFSDVPEVEETGRTFEENAILKARKYFEWSGIPSVADDGGLEIDFLNGEPGVLSRRWSFDFAPSTSLRISQDKPGPERTDQELIDIALAKLKGVSWEKRTAHLRTVGAYYNGKNISTETAAVDGYIIEESDGKIEAGYPFRSIFWIPEFKKLYRDLAQEEHEQINHRKTVYSKLAAKIVVDKDVYNR